MQQQIITNYKLSPLRIITLFKCIIMDYYIIIIIIKKYWCARTQSYYKNKESRTIHYSWSHCIVTLLYTLYCTCAFLHYHLNYPELAPPIFLPQFKLAPLIPRLQTYSSHQLDAADLLDRTEPN